MDYHHHQHGQAPSLMPSLLLFVGRILTATALLATALAYILHFEQASSAISALGVPLPKLYCSVAFGITLMSALSLALGWKTRGGAAVGALYCIANAALYYHTSSSTETVNMLAIIGGLLAFMSAGAGRFSMDRLLRGRQQPGQWAEAPGHESSPASSTRRVTSFIRRG